MSAAAMARARLRAAAERWPAVGRVLWPAARTLRARPAPSGPPPEPPPTADEDDPAAIAARYAGSFPAPAVSYATVADSIDSAAVMPGLARVGGRAGRGLTDAQRCWIVKAVLGGVEPGGRLLEVGAGWPAAAPLLARLGYEVTVIDPYDRGPGGPREVEDLRRTYPSVRFVRGRLPEDEPPGGPFGAVYSVSVLDGMDPQEAATVVAAGHGLLAPGGRSLHAVDHVVSGWGAAGHRERLDRVAAALGIAATELDAVLSRMDGDPETLFVSAETHEVRRGDLPREVYPERRAGSVNLVAPRLTEPRR